MLKKLQEIKDNAEIDTIDNSVRLDKSDFNWVLKTLGAQFGALEGVVDDSIDYFIGTHCDVGNGEEVHSIHLHNIYTEWAIENKMIVLRFGDFNRLLQGKMTMHRHHGIIWHAGLIKQ